MAMDDIVTASVTEAILRNHFYAHEEFMRKKGIYFPFTYLDSSKYLLRDVTFTFILDQLFKQSSPGQTNPSAPPLVIYHIRLVPLNINRPPRLATIHFWKQPESGLDIKREIERECEIPFSTICLHYQDKPVLNSTMLSSVGLGNKDTIEVTYESEGDLDEVHIGYRWFEFISRLSAGQRPSEWTGIPAELEYFVTAGLREDLPQKLAQCLHGESRRSIANRVYFKQVDGVRVVSKVYEMLCLDSWRCMPFSLKLVEIGCVEVLAALNYEESILKTNLIKLDLVGYVVRSLMRAKVARGSKITDPSGGRGRQEHRDFLVTELVKACLTFLIRIYEHPLVHQDVTSNHELLEQLVCLLHSPSITSLQAQGILCIMGASLLSEDNKRWITSKSNVLEWLLEVVKVRRKLEGKHENDVVMFEFFLLMFISSVVLTESCRISWRLHRRLLLTLDSLLCRTTPSPDIVRSPSQDIVSKNTILTVSPFGSRPISTLLKMLYPRQDKDVKRSHHKDDLFALHHLQELGIESMLVALRVFVQAYPEETLEQARMCKLLEYFVCLPNNLPLRLKDKGRETVKMAFGDQPIPVPSLQGIVKAFLAKCYFGLPDIMEKKIEDIQKVIGPPPKKEIDDQPLPSFYILKLTG